MLLIAETGSCRERIYDRDLGYQYLFHYETLSLDWFKEKPPKDKREICGSF
jgi:hypothetical protein